MSDYLERREKIHRILNLARGANNQQNPDQAIALIRKIELDGAEEGFEQEWAESRLILAEAYTAKGDPLSESLFEETFELLKQLKSPEIALEFRAHEHFGDYLRRFAKRPSLARQEFEAAKARVLELRSAEDSARIQLKLESIALEMDKSPETENFVTLKHTAKELGYTCAEQFAAWLYHKGQAAEHNQGLRFARNKARAGEAYFKYLLEMVRMKV
jgi:hypothetical protein